MRAMDLEKMLNVGIIGLGHIARAVTEGDLQRYRQIRNRYKGSIIIHPMRAQLVNSFLEKALQLFLEVHRHFFLMV